MSIFLEPVYLNEKMVLNAAAYLFKGYSLESESISEDSSANKGNIKLGFKFLQDLISPINAEANQEKFSKKEMKTSRRYTLGGLHMVLLDELYKKNNLVKFNQTQSESKSQDVYIDIEAILKPVDLFSILEVIKIAIPLVMQVIQNFGPKISQKIDENLMKDAIKYEEILMSILKQVETDYMKSNQLEMIMVSPENKKQIGIVDLDVTDVDPLEIKARLNDGKFHIIGKITKTVSNGDELSLVQRTFLSTVVNILTKVVNLNTDPTKILGFQTDIATIRPIVEQLCQLQIPGPAYRIMAMSVCV